MPITTSSYIVSLNFPSCNCTRGLDYQPRFGKEARVPPRCIVSGRNVDWIRESGWNPAYCTHSCFLTERSLGQLTEIIAAPRSSHWPDRRTSLVKPWLWKVPQHKPFFLDLGAMMEPNQGRKKKARRPKRRSSQTSDSQGAAGPSTRGPNSEAGT